MKPVHPLHEFMPYGAPDLLVAQRPHLSRALALASSAALLIWVGLCSVVPGLAPPPVPPFEPVLPRIVEPMLFDVLPELRTEGLRAVTPAVPTDGKIVSVPLAPPEEVAVEYKGEPITPGTSPAELCLCSPEQNVPPGVSVVVLDDPVTVVDEFPVAASKVTPDYPAFARDAMVEGRVIVLVLVGRDGRVREAKLDEKNHSPLLDEAALEAARRWVFSPATVNGHPVAVWTAIPFRFVLNESGVR